MCSSTGYSSISFLATFDTDTLIPTNPIVFNYPVHNAGGYYDSITGIYTVPLDGTYEFIVSIRSYDDITLGAWLTVDSDDVSKATALHFVIKIIVEEICSRMKVTKLV